VSGTKRIKQKDGVVVGLPNGATLGKKFSPKAFDDFIPPHWRLEFFNERACYP
jgi:hypothetical protein